MRDNPYAVTGPAIISFSGGRTSGYMLRHTPPPYEAIEAEAAALADKIGKDVTDPYGRDDPGLQALLACTRTRRDNSALYEAVKKLSDPDLERLQTLLSVIAFGQGNCDALDTGGSLFNEVACDLEADMRNHWMPDRAFLERRTKYQLVTIAKQCGFADGHGLLGGYKKGELVSAMVRFFEEARHVSEPSEAQQKALAWLPEAMQFPAVDPDALEGGEADQDDPGEHGRDYEQTEPAGISS